MAYAGRDGSADERPVDTAPVMIERSPADVLRVVVAATVLLVVLVVESLFGATLVQFGSDFLAGLGAVPSWLLDLVILGTRILGLMVFGGGTIRACPATLAAKPPSPSRRWWRFCSPRPGELFPTDAGRTSPTKRPRRPLPTG
jgi:hypothetical protein